MMENNVVLVVDDTPDTLALLHDNLVESGFTVLVATNGEAAIKICQNSSPDIVLLDAMMPEMDGFEVCRLLKKSLATRHIPVIFMTGLTDSEHVVKGFKSGGIDYVTKPLNSMEVIARLNTHLNNARMMSHTRGVLDAFGQAAIALLPSTTKIIWQTPLAKELLNKYFELEQHKPNDNFDVLENWVKELSKGGLERITSMTIDFSTGRLVFTAADVSNEEQWVILLREESEAAQIAGLKAIFNLTNREAEVLHWAALGKTDKEIGEILVMSPRTANKHMEHVFEKLGVETRTAAAALVISKAKNLPK